MSISFCEEELRSGTKRVWTFSILVPSSFSGNRRQGRRSIARRQVVMQARYAPNALTRTAEGAGPEALWQIGRNASRAFRRIACARRVRYDHFMTIKQRPWQEELAIIDRTMKAISVISDPEQLVEAYWGGIGELVPVNDYVA